MKLFSAAFGIAILAQTAIDPGTGASSPVKFDIGNITATAILGWYAWHTASRVIPGLVKDFREEMQFERQAHDAETAAQRTSAEQERAAFLKLVQDIQFQSGKKG